MKIRAWDVEEGCWIPADAIAVTAKGELLTYDVVGDRWALETLEYRLFQSMEVPDKNGKEIFAGDYVSVVYGGKFVGVVEYIAPSFQIISLKSSKCWNIPPSASMEVVGNVCENPKIGESASVDATRSLK